MTDAPNASASRRGAAWCIAAVVLGLLLLRLPSLFEPAWSADEGAYADIGRALDHGAVLYRDVWDNKPPGVYWLAAAVNLGGASVFRMQLLALVAVGAGALIVFGLLRALRSNAAGLLGACAYLVFASLPLFSGDELNTEILAVVPAAGAMLLVLPAPRPLATRRLVAAGLLLAVAFIIDVRTVLDLFAVCTIVAAGAAPQGIALAVRLRAASWVFGAWLLTLAVVSVPLALGGSFGGMLSALVAKNAGYVAYFQAQSQFAVGHLSVVQPLTLAVAGLRLLLTAAAGALCARWAWRRGHATLAAAVWWLTCDVVAASLDARAFTHYIQLCAASAAVVATLLAAGIAHRRLPGRRVLATAAVLAIWPFAIVVLYLPPLAAALATRSAVPAPQLLQLQATATYLEQGWARIAGSIAPATYAAHFQNDIYPEDERLAALVDAHSTPAEPVFVWGGVDPWTYALADRVPSSRFVWMDSAYVIDPSNQHVALADLARRPPAILVVGSALPQQLTQMLLAAHYSTWWSATANVQYWLAPGG